MDCRTVNELLAGERGDDLTEAESSAFESHLEDCAACRDRLAAAEDELAPLAAWEPDEPSAEQWRRVTDGVRAELLAAPVLAFRPTRLPALLAAAAAVLLIVGATVLIQLQPGGSGGPGTPGGGAVNTMGGEPPVVVREGDVEVLEVEPGPGRTAEVEPLGQGGVGVVVSQTQDD